MLACAGLESADRTLLAVACARWRAAGLLRGQAEAAEAGMHGSPTILVDGADPFARPGQDPGMACRLYRQDDGSLAPAPPAGELRRVLARASRP